MKREKADLKDLSDILSNLEKKIYKDNPQFQFWQLQKKWSHIVGDIMARESYIGRLEGTILFICVTNSSCCQELMMLKNDILKKIRSYPVGQNIEDIRFQIANNQKLSTKPDLPGVMPVKENISHGMVSEAEKEKIDSWTKEHVSGKIKDVFSQMMIESLKKKRGEEQAGWRPCKRCGVLCREGEILCVRCRIQKEREIINKIILILKEEPHFRWEDVKKFIPCSYSQYEEGWETLVYRYRDCIYNGHDTEEERKKLLCMQLHRPMEEVTEEETERMVSHAPRRQKNKKDFDLK